MYRSLHPCGAEGGGSLHPSQGKLTEAHDGFGGSWCGRSYGACVLTWGVPYHGAYKNGRFGDLRNLKLLLRYNEEAVARQEPRRNSGRLPVRSGNNVNDRHGRTQKCGSSSHRIKHLSDFPSTDKTIDLFQVSKALQGPKIKVGGSACFRRFECILLTPLNLKG